MGFSPPITINTDIVCNQQRYFCNLVSSAGSLCLRYVQIIKNRVVDVHCIYTSWPVTLWDLCHRCGYSTEGWCEKTVNVYNSQFILVGNMFFGKTLKEKENV